jgi:hypothetical protein
MKLERIKAADQTELPKAKPLKRNQSVSKSRALHPERKRMPERIAMRTYRTFYTAQRQSQSDSSVDGEMVMSIQANSFNLAP